MKLEGIALRFWIDSIDSLPAVPAERTSSILRGEGDAQKNTILADAYGLDEDFFDFLRTMQACRDTFGDTEMSMVIAPGQVCEKFFGEIEIDN